MSDSLPCPTWVFASGPNVQYAAHAFHLSTTNTPRIIKSSPTSSLQADQANDDVQIPLIGIGTVEIPARLGPPDMAVHGTPRLRKVLHAPGALCNVIGQPVLKDYSVSCTGQIWTVNDEQGSTVAYLDQLNGLPQLRISEPPVGPQLGPSRLTPGSSYLINTFWSDEERDKIMPDLGSPSP